MIWCVHRLWFIKDFSPRMRHETFGSHKQCSANDWVEWVIVGKLGHENPSESVSLKSIPPFLEIEFQKLIDAFCLIICFQMKDSWEFDINVYVKIYLFPKVADKLRTTIWYNEIRSIIFSIKFSESGVICTNNINLSHKHKHGIFWETVHNNHHIGADLFMNINEWR